MAISELYGYAMTKNSSEQVSKIIMETPEFCSAARIPPTSTATPTKPCRPYNREVDPIGLVVSVDRMERERVRKSALKEIEENMD